MEQFMEQKGVRVSENISNLKRQKVLQYTNKKHAKRTVSFFGFVAKLQQALANQDSFFVYYANDRIQEFLKLLRTGGFVQAYYLMPATALGVKLSPEFNQRVLVVYLKPASKFGRALNAVKLVSIPSRSVTVTYSQLLAKSLGSGISSMYVLNTSKGLLTHTKALQYQIGGELVCEIS